MTRSACKRQKGDFVTLPSTIKPVLAATATVQKMKRLIICCDGTWNTPQSDHVTNVVHVARAISPRTESGIAQVVFYDWGVGTDDKLDALSGGAAGKGIDKNIRDAYRFLIHNYAPGDEVWFFGFSRGAYTARSCIGLIRNCWLLHKNKASLIDKAYHIYRTKWHADAENALAFREPNCQPLDVKFLGVWDTVGALGIPIGLLNHLHGDRYEFHDTTISSIVKNAYHALAIDEKRKPFAPAIWRTKSGRTHTEQSWFAGVHSDIGGGYRQAGLSHVALQWMLDKAAMCGLALDQTYLSDVFAANPEARLHKSLRGPMRLLGAQHRALGVTNNDETLHSSVEQRFTQDDSYRPKNLLEYLARDEQIRLPL